MSDLMPNEKTRKSLQFQTQKTLNLCEDELPEELLQEMNSNLNEIEPMMIEIAVTDNSAKKPFEI